MNPQETKKIKCPVCGKTEVEEFDICEVCGWENDLNQLAFPFLRGANSMTIDEAREAYKKGERIH